MITITAEPKAAVPVELVGTEYKIQPPKAALALKLAVRAKQAGEAPELMVKALEEWILKAFGKKEGTAVLKRLDDENDALDYDHIMTLMNLLIEETAGNPTS